MTQGNRDSTRLRNRTAGGHVTLRLSVRQPFDGAGLLEFLADHAVPGMEAVNEGSFARLVSLPHGAGAIELTPAPDHVRARFELLDLRDTGAAVQHSRQLLDLDADPIAVDTVLGAAPALAERVREAPGIRVPGGFDVVETAVRAIIGQQVSVARAGTMLGGLVEQYGERVDLALGADHGLTGLFPSTAALADIDAESLPMPRARGRAVAALAAAALAGSLDVSPGADRKTARAELLALPGVGPWTADYVLMRGLGDPDVLLTTDLVLRRELARRDITPADTEAWRPWRSYASMHLWRSATRPERIRP